MQRKRDGLTLIEVMLAMALFGLVFAILANTQVTSAKVTRDSQEASVAMQKANDALERTLAEIYVDLEEYYKCGHEVALVECEIIGVLDDGYQYSVEIAGMYIEPTDPAHDPLAMDEFLNEGLLRVQVAVTGPASVSFTSYVSCYDVAADLTLEEGAPCPDPYDPIAF